MMRRARIKGGRAWKSGGYAPAVSREIERDAKRFGVSLSFVQTAIVTQHYERVLRKKFDEAPLPASRRKLRLVRGKRAA